MLENYLAQFTPEQCSLRDAFAAYARAMQASDGKTKAELMLLGNALIGAHEQRLVQPFLDQLFDAPEPVFRAAIAGTLQLLKAGLPCSIRVLLRLRLWRTHAVEALTNHASALFHRVATEVWVGPHAREMLELGDDLPNPPGLGASYPPDLQDLKDPGTGRAGRAVRPRARHIGGIRDRRLEQLRPTNELHRGALPQSGPGSLPVRPALSRGDRAGRVAAQYPIRLSVNGVPNVLSSFHVARLSARRLPVKSFRRMLAIL